MTDDLRILPGAPLPDELQIAEALADDYRRMREDITGRGQSRPTHVSQVMIDLDGDEVVKTVDPRSKRQARYSHEEKRAYAAYLRDHMTSAEWTLWQELQPWAEQGIRFDAQALVRGWVVDFYCEALKLVIEVDGGVHSNNAQWQRDQHKDVILKRDGYTVLRLTNDAVLSNVNSVAARILDTIAGMEAPHAG